MNICHFVDHLDSGGGQKVILDLIENIDENISHSVCYLKQKDTHSSFRPAFENVGISIHGFGAESIADLSAIRGMIQFFRRRQFDVLHMHTVYAQLAGRLFGHLANIDASVSTYHMTADLWHHDPGLQVLETTTRSVDDALVAVSNGVQNSLADGEPHWRTIHNGVDVELYNSRSRKAPEDLRKEVGASQEAPTFVNLGRFIPEKSQMDLVSAMSKVINQIPDANLVIVGGGDLQTDLEQAVQEYELENHVYIHDHTDSPLKYYSLADVFVLSSVNEGLPLVVLEAMAAGLPIVATDIPGVNEAMIDGETGLLVPPRTPEALADAMIRMESRHLRERFGKRGYEHAASEFSIERTAEKYQNLYWELTA